MILIAEQRMSLKKNTSNLFQSLYGLTEINNREIRVCLVISLVISLGVTVVGGFVEFQSSGFSIKWLLATIEHFSNALPFSIFLCLVSLVVVDKIREVKMRSDKIREELKNEGRREALEQCKDWFENGRENPPPWDTKGRTSVRQSAERKQVDKSVKRR